MPLRSGRFKLAGNGASSLKIATGRKGRLRVFNSSASEFDITSSSAGFTAKLLSEQSVDLPVDGDVFVSIASASAVEGIYEYIQEGAELRSGRFKGTTSATSVIVKEGNKELYRVMNSGDVPFEINVGGVALTTLAPAMSIDFAANGDVKLVAAAGVKVEAIYDALYESADIRSGRFKFLTVIDPNTGTPIENPAYPHPIIDLRAAGETAWYRLFNSGDNEIVILKNTNMNPEIGRVLPQNSFDFQLPTAVSQRKITVKSADSILPIEGSFDLVNDPSA